MKYIVSLLLIFSTINIYSQIVKEDKNNRVVNPEVADLTALAASSYPLNSLITVQVQAMFIK